MKKLKQREPGTLNSEFINVRNNILFGNICRLYPGVLPKTKHTVQECESIASDNLQHGLLSFLFHLAYNVDFYMNTSAASSFSYDAGTMTEI